MHERRRRTVKDTGARTRRTDHANSPHVLQDWVTTFNLRWVEHLTAKDHDDRRHAA